MTTPAQPQAQARKPAPRPAARPAPARPGPAAAAKTTPQGAALSYAAGKGGQAARNAGRAAAQARVVPGNRAYQPVLLAEFLAAVVIVALAPVATGGSDTAKAKGGISPYDTTDLRQLVAVGAVYFVLALASSGNSGRLSAWLGGLILIAIGMGKLAHGNLSAVFHTVTPDTGTGKQAGETATGAV